MFALILRALGWVSFLLFAGEYLGNQQFSWFWVWVTFLFMFFGYLLKKD